MTNRQSQGLRSFVALVGLAAMSMAACAGTAPSATQGAPPGSAAIDASGPGSRAGAPAGADFVYVTSQGSATIGVISVESLELVETIDLRALGFSENAKPHHIAVEPDGSHWYVSLIGENRVLKFDRANRLVGQVEFEVPGLLALHPEEDLLFVGRSMSAVNPPQRIGMIDRSEMEMIEEIDVFFPRPHALAVNPGVNRVYSASLALNQLASVDFEEEAVELTTLAGDEIHTLVQFAVSPDGRTLVATAQLTNRLLVFDLTDPDRPELAEEIPVEAQPWHPVFSPDGRFVYFGNKLADAVTVVDVAGRRVIEVVRGEGLDEPHGAAVSPDGRYLFVSNSATGMVMDMSGGAMRMDPAEHEPRNGTVVVLDAVARRIVKVIEVGMNATGIGARSPR